MRKKLLKSLAAVLMLATLLPMSAFAAEPYITWTTGPDNWVVDTQTAYTPEEVLTYGLNAPEDLYIDETNTMYICDTGNKRIVKVDASGNVTEFSDDIMVKPTGIHVAEGHIYVADNELKEILIYSMDFELENRIGRPTEAIFGEGTKYAPSKLITDARGNIYVVSEGSIAGLMQFNPEGEFLGYFGSNATNTSLKMILQRTFFTEEQLNKMFKNAPPSITNVGIDKQGLVYTVTNTGDDNAVSVKKLSISGLDLFDGGMRGGSMVDVDVDPDGNVFIVNTEGMIFEHDSNGDFLFAFGGKGDDQVRVGLLREPAAIDVTDNQHIYVLDKGQNAVIHYATTEFAQKVHEGISMYNDGKYQESETVWKDIRKMNSNFIFAYRALAKSDYKKQNYDSALNFFEVAGDKEGYSQTYWVYRNQWLQKNLGTAVIILIVLLILWKIIRVIDKRKGILEPARKLKQKLGGIPLVAQVTYARNMIKSPMDAYWEMKFKGKVSIASATVLYVWLFVLKLTDIYVVSYLFNTTEWWSLNLFNEILWTVAPVALFIVCNYLVSTITDGEGKVKDLYCCTIYALTPYLMLALPMQIITHALTLNEGFIYDFGMAAIMAWCVVLFVMMVKEIHDYSLGKTFKNLAVTAFTIALFLLAGFIIYLLFGQLKDFVISIMQEVAARG